jgi:hypothetical protein
MDKYTLEIINKLKSTRRTLSTKLFERSDFYNRYFAELDLSNNELTKSSQNYFDKKMKLALEEQAANHLLRMFVFIILSPLMFISITYISIEIILPYVETSLGIGLITALFLSSIIPAFLAENSWKDSKHISN